MVSRSDWFILNSLSRGVGKWFHKYTDCKDSSRCLKVHIVRPLTDRFGESRKSHVPGIIKQLKAVDQQRQEKVEDQQFFASQVEIFNLTPETLSVRTRKITGPQTIFVNTQRRTSRYKSKFLSFINQYLFDQPDSTQSVARGKAVVIMTVPSRFESIKIGKEKDRKRRRLVYR